MPGFVIGFDRRIKPAMVLAATLALPWLDCVRAAEDPQPPAAGSGVAKAFKAKPLSEADRRFLLEASAAGAAAIAMGRVAAKQGGLSQVRLFGAQMMREHSRSNAELRKIALDYGIKTVDDPTPEQNEAFEKFRQMPASKFDPAYVKMQQEDHAKVIALFRRQAENGSDSQLKQFAAAMLPMLEAHEKKAKAMR